ncbi:23S rRNA pseudouridylate synthase [Bifidobacterium sp. MA2]|uniref:RNA pseudouridylate synthase n=1 Tax=Bifidobacterium santillanense TaxID=2809028 RepID=A0ABS5UNA2_9BIFI|nr:pseudouridine synthase [Bifidobacterium santillanense]MBT1172395.1 23S rRNA pseudouridylate synthase [Bifidobacterium santillanense]
MASHHRFVTSEPAIPFELDVVYEDAGIIVVDKPHFLATTPRGMWYRETALMRLREMYGDDSITPAHRLDRLTAGIVVFVREPSLRGAYQMLFQERRTSKTYECLAPCAPITRPRYGTIERLEPPRVFPLRRRSRIVKERGVLQAYEEPGAVNAETIIEPGEWRSGGSVESTGRPITAVPHLCADPVDSAARPFVAVSHSHAASEGGRSADPSSVPLSVGRGRRVGRRIIRAGRSVVSSSNSVRAYTLHPLTGKTHQLRVHMNSLGLPILGDDFYPRVVQRAYDDFSQPLELVARRLAFTDPVSGEPREFVSRIPLGRVGR